MGAEAPPPEMDPVDVAPPEDEGADPVGDMGGEEPEEMMQEDDATEGHRGGDLNDDLVNEVARRVAARLMGKRKTK